MLYPVGTATTPGNGTDGMLGLIHQTGSTASMSECNAG